MFCRTSSSRIAPIYGLRLIAVVSLTSLLAACQSGPPSLSLDEAKQVTASFKVGGFTAPPRTIKDIEIYLPRPSRGLAPTELLGPHCEGREWDTAIIDKFKRMAKEWGSGERVKSTDRDVNDWDVQYGREFNRRIGEFYHRRGNLPEAVKYMGLWKNAIPSDWKGTLITAYALLASMQVDAGNIREAERSLSRVATYSAQTRSRNKWRDMFVMRARAALAEANGELEKAAGLLRRAVASFQSFAPDSHRIPAITSNLARVLSRQGRLAEAELKSRDALKLRIRKGLSDARGAPLIHRFSQVLSRMGRYEEAETVARSAVSIYQDMCISPRSVQAALARRSLADSLAAQGRWSEAIGLFESIREGLASDPTTFESRFAGDPTWALALLNTGRAEEAKTMLETAHERLVKQVGAKHFRSAETLGLIAMARAATGDTDGALEAFPKALEILLTRSRQMDDAETGQAMRDRNLKSIIESYITLLHDQGEAKGIAAIDRAAEAFRLANAAGTRGVQRALSASAARSAAGDPALADLVRREQDAQQRIAALFGTLITLQSTWGGNVDADEIKNLRTEIDQLRGARAALMEEIESRFPDYAELINPQPPTITEARTSMRPGEALITTYVGAERTFVWAVPHDGEVAFAAVDIGREELSDTVAMLRSALEPNAQTLGDIPEFDLAAAYALYSKLLEPVKAGWRDAESLLVVAHGPLGYLPLSVLPTEPIELAPSGQGETLFANYRDIPWLAREHSVTVLPSVASLRALRGLPPANIERKSYAGFGDPLFSLEQAAEAKAEEATGVVAMANRGLETRGLPVRLRAAPNTTEFDSAELALLPRLPDTADEIKSTAIALNADLTQDVFLGARANEQMVKTMDLSGYKVIAFATHGLVPGDLNGLTQPALALSAPEVAGVGGDGLLTMGEILGLKLDADWVVLSACNTGSGEGAGAEAVSGLGRAFFYAGTRALLVSNWPVETTSAKVLTTDLFRRQAEDPTLTRAEALRKAMLGLIDGPGFVDPESGKTVFSYAHPIFWAPFTLIGDGGGRRAPSS